MRWRTSMIALALTTSACGGEGTELEQSCRGRAVPNCLPYELAEIVEASVTPADVSVGDPSVEVAFRVLFDRCPELDANHEITVQLRDGERLQDLITLRDDGMDGDAMAGDGLVEKTLGNPFIGPLIPSSRTVQLRFQTRVRPRCDGASCVGGTCRSAAFETDYRLGPAFDPT